MDPRITPTLGSGAHSPRPPGVWLEWSARAPAAAPISGVPLFVGFVEPHAHEPQALRGSPAVRLERWEDWSRSVARRALGWLDYAVKGFFDNGGRRCWVWALPMNAHASSSTLRQALLSCFDSGSPLEDLAEPDLVCVPDASFGALAKDSAATLAVQHAALAHCQRMNDRMALLDCLPRRAEQPGASVAQPHGRIALLAAWQHDQEVARSGHHSNGAVYWPWITVRELPRHARGAPATLAVPPCGHVAGVIARLDAAGGRHKAPANEPLEGALDVDEETDDATLAELNEDGINALRVLPGRGVYVCGARTLSTLPAARYVSVRRVVLGLARWAQTGLLDLVMESNDHTLWERIRQRVNAYCLARYQEGALKGDSPTEAFFVKCDAETNPKEHRELGRVVCEVGLAATVPAEYIVVQLIQSTDGAALAG